MERALVAVVAFVVAASGGEVKAPHDLFVKESVIHGGEDVGIETEGEFAYVARAFVLIQDVVDTGGVVGRGLDDFTLLKAQADIPEGEAVVGGGRIVSQGSLDGILDWGGEELSVGDVGLSGTLDGG